jgi:hypothetical protein
VITEDGQSRATTAFDVLSFGSNSPIPEPASWAMLIAGAALVGGAIRRSRSLAAT